MEIEGDNQLAQEIERSLHERHGPMLGGAALCRALGFPTAAAMRQAVSRGRMPVPLFDIENRRGRFALTRDVARWLARCRAAGLTQPSSVQQNATAPAAKENDM
jgi:hypothetical protein